MTIMKLTAEAPNMVSTARYPPEALNRGGSFATSPR